MPIFIDTTGRSRYSVAICDRCSCKFPWDELVIDPNSPGLRVCPADRDDYDPYRLPARRTENISLPWTRPDRALDGFTAVANPPPPLLMGVPGNPSAQLSWIVTNNAAAITNQYILSRSTNVLPTDPAFGSSFVPILTVEINFREDLITNFFYDDPGLDFSANFYHYYVDALRVSGPSAIARSNVIVLGDGPAPVVLSGVYNAISVEFELSWTAAVSPRAIASYEVFRSVDGSAFTQLVQVSGVTLVFNDDDVDRDNHVYAYYVQSTDALGIPSLPSNIVTLTGSSPLFVAFGVGPNVWTSPTGSDSWTLILTGGSNFDLRAMAFSPSLQRAVIVGQNGKTQYSDDGVNWIEGLQDPLALARSQGVAWSPTLNLFVSVSGNFNGFRAQSSPDGITWTRRATPAGANLTWEDVLWVPWANGGAGAFIAGAANGLSNVMWSADGITWNQITPAATGGINGLMDNGSRLVTWNQGDVQNGFTTGDPILPASWSYGPNGLSGGYTCGHTRTDGGDNFIISVSTKFVGSIGKVAVDADGAGTWTKLTLPAVEQQWRGMTFSPELDRYVAVAQQVNDFAVTQLCMFSDDSGATWALGITPDWSTLVTDVFYSLFGVATPSAPVLSVFENVPLNQAELTWTASVGVNPISQYVVYRSVDGANFGLYDTVVGSILAYDDTSINTGLHTYDYYVQGIDSVGLVSTPSNIAGI